MWPLKLFMLSLEQRHQDWECYCKVLGEGKPGHVFSRAVQRAQWKIQLAGWGWRIMSWETHFWDVKVILSTSKQSAVLLQLLGSLVRILYELQNWAQNFLFTVLPRKTFAHGATCYCYECTTYERRGSGLWWLYILKRNVAVWSLVKFELVEFFSGYSIYCFGKTWVMRAWIINLLTPALQMFLSRKYCATEQMEAGFEEPNCSTTIFRSVDIILTINNK